MNVFYNIFLLLLLICTQQLYCSILGDLVDIFLDKSNTKINTKYGCVKGHRSTRNEDVVEFLGIPYAQPPVGCNRFKPPVPLGDKYYGKSCFEADFLGKSCYFKRKLSKFAGIDDWLPHKNDLSEDCLQLNIWVPKNKTGAVIVFINGRSFNRGSASIPNYNGNVLASTTGAIVVSFNYRIGALGFIQLKKGKFSSGNLGLLDQQMALKWIYQNIEYFGGEKSKITLFGHGAGSSCATAHMFSEGSKKYFSRIVAVSGTIYNKWALEKSKFVDENVKSLLKKLKCNSKNKKKEAKCMKYVSVHKIIDAADKIRNLKQFEIENPFMPVDNDGYFFKQPLKKMLENGNFKNDVDILIGKTTHEASIFLHQYLSGKKYGCSFDPSKGVESKANQCDMNKNQYKNSIESLVQAFRLKKSAINKIIKLYKSPKKRSYRDTAVRIFSDFFFDCEFVQFARKISTVLKKQNRYFYIFGKRNPTNPWPKWMGVTHDYQTQYMFGHPFSSKDAYGKNVTDEQKFSYQVMYTLGKFANTGSLYRSNPQFSKNNVTASLVTRILKDGDKFKTKDADTMHCKLIEDIKDSLKSKKSIKPRKSNKPKKSDKPKKSGKPKKSKQSKNPKKSEKPKKSRKSEESKKSKHHHSKSKKCHGH